MLIRDAATAVHFAREEFGYCPNQEPVHLEDLFAFGAAVLSVIWIYTALIWYGRH